MIKTLEASFFRKHEALHIDFTSGLNVLRGANESGKSTATEIILYALYGAAALVDTLADVVTWGHKESELRVVLVITIGITDYTFTRSKAGAECTYVGPNGTTLMVTGQREVTNFAAGLLGADAKTAGVLMLASQAGLRGALDDGPTAVSSLMGKLADFEMVDRLLESASQTLSLGSAQPLTVKLTEAENLALDATSRLVDPAVFKVLDEQISTATAAHEKAEAESEVLTDAVTKADDERDAAVANNASHATAWRTVTENQTKLNNEQSAYDRAVVQSRSRPTPAALEAARAALVAAKNHDTLTSAYAVYGTLGSYPVSHWDDTKESFEVELKAATVLRDDVTLRIRETAADIVHLKKTLISGDGKCPTCGHLAENHSHTLERNAEIQAKIDEIAKNQAAAEAVFREHAETVKALEAVAACAKRRQTVIDKIAGYLIFDISVYPQRVEWNGPPPTDQADVSKAKRTLDILEDQERAATQAEGRAAAHATHVAEMQKALDWAKDVANRMKLIPVEPLTEAYEKAFRTHQEQAAKAREISYTLTNLFETKSLAERTAASAEAELKAAQARVIELQADIKALEFNNELVKRLKSMKPMITDFLWNNVLAAVSNYFSTLRGEQSIVTKDASGFKVNGRGGSLSGSTLDVLALSIRVALSKTFVPHANFMVLDEPAHGCDSVRTGNLLGFLAGVGFNQTILASHDELSEAVANNVIVLGA